MKYLITVTRDDDSLVTQFVTSEQLGEFAIRQLREMEELGDDTHEVKKDG